MTALVTPVKRLALALLLALTLAPAAPGDARPAEPAHRLVSGCQGKGDYHVCFSSPPTQGGRDTAVVDRFTALFNAAGAGDTLLVAMFRWDIGTPADAIIAAQQRGARVEIVADDDLLTKTAGRRVLKQIEDGDPARTNVTVCAGACLPWRAPGPYPPSQNIQHLKMVVAEIGGKPLFVTSSSNLEGRQYPQYNSIITIADAGLHRFGVRYFKRLKAQSTQGWNDRRKVHFGGSRTAAVYPRRKDLLLSTLRSVQCVPGADTVSAMISVIQRYDIREQLARLQASGCRVRVLTTRELVENFVQARFQLADGTYVDIPDKHVRTVHTHDKMVAIHARVRGAVRHVVVTGTSNSTCGGFLYNDEVMMRLEDRWLFERYLEHFDDAYRHAKQSTVSLIPAQRKCF